MPIGAAIGSAVASMAANSKGMLATCSPPFGGNYPPGAGAQINKATAWPNAVAGAWSGAVGFSGIPGWNATGVGSQPEYRDPLEYATETALAQPADKRWRRFQHAMFLAEDVISFGCQGSGTIEVHIRLCNATRTEYFTLPFNCSDPLQWFGEHVLQMEFPNAKRAT